MRPRLESLIVPAFLVALAAIGCTRAPEKPASPVHDDLNDVAKASQKAAKDIGHATIEVADKAGEKVKDATNKAGASSEDAWLTTKVKSALTSEGFDPVHVHVDTDSKVVTLSGTVESAAKKEKAVSLAKGVTGVVDVRDHLFVKAEK
jgi:hyperosmotically inducible protein